MSKTANAGELRTPVAFFQTVRSVDAQGFTKAEEVNVFGSGVSIPCKWVNAHGSQVFEAMQLELREPATLTMRYSPKINAQLILYRGSDPQPYEIISADNVEEKNVWLEIKVQRKVAAR